jgi:hypothetical protein
MATFIGLSYTRTVGILAIAMAPLAAQTLQSWSGSQVRPVALSGANRAIAVIMVVVTTVLGTLWLAQIPGIKKGAPYAATRFLDDLPGRAKVINEYEFGGWLLWAGRDVSPGIDGRAETKTVEYLNEYVSTLNLQGDWRSFVRGLDADAAWLRKEAPLVEGLRLLGWQTVHEDDFTYVLVPPAEGAV